jgi:transposase
VQRNINGTQRFSVQLCCEGKTLSAKDRHLLRSRKPSEERRTPLISEGGPVGMDIGPSTIAIVGEKDAVLIRFCDEIEPKREEIGKLQKQLDRQRRANNPQNFEENGTIKKGRKTWFRSERQKETQESLAEMQRRTAAHRKNLHGSLLNSLPLHEDFYLEKLSYRSFQKNFGRSVGMRAPGMFVEELKRKAISAGGSVYEFPTATTKLSQTCHCGKIQKKSLSERWHTCGCGVEAQRDLYSAYLSRFVREGKLNAAGAAKHWQSGESLLRTAFERIQVASRGPPPASFGIKNRRQSGSSAVEGIAKGQYSLDKSAKFSEHEVA